MPRASCTYDGHRSRKRKRRGEAAARFPSLTLPAPTNLVARLVPAGSLLLLQAHPAHNVHQNTLVAFPRP